LIPCVSIGQIDLSGIVLDSLDQKPVPFATVFINGTIKGTTTDAEGKFTIPNISIPAQVVVSHLSYVSKVTQIDSENTKGLKIVLNSEVKNLPEISVGEKSLRQQNLIVFKKLFLGENVFGQTAELKNDSALIFNRHYTLEIMVVTDSIQDEIDSGRLNQRAIESWSADSTSINVRRKLNIEVTADEPLIIDMPKLGYQLHLELILFTAEYSKRNVQSAFKGYFYFQPYLNVTKGKAKKYAKNRQYVYYNSSQHFFRSLFQNKLAKNGYRVIEKNYDKSKGRDVYQDFDINRYVKYRSEDLMEVVGLSNRDLFVYYFDRSGRKPLDLSVKSGYDGLKSRLHFLDIACAVRADGTIPDSNILFGGWIGEKKVGSLLPNDYESIDLD